MLCLAPCWVNLQQPYKLPFAEGAFPQAEKGAGTICAERAAGRSDKWFLTPSLSWSGQKMVPDTLVFSLLFGFRRAEPGASSRATIV
jgi:hypothetical protein